MLWHIYSFTLTTLYFYTASQPSLESGLYFIFSAYNKQIIGSLTELHLVVQYAFQLGVTPLFESHCDPSVRLFGEANLRQPSFYPPAGNDTPLWLQMEEPRLISCFKISALAP